MNDIHDCARTEENLAWALHRLVAAEKVVEAARAWTECDCYGCGVCIESISDSVAAYDTATKAPDSPKETP